MASNDTSTSASVDGQGVPVQEEKQTLMGWFNRHSAGFFALVMILLLYSGWTNREFSYLKPDDGAGYFLGIIGGTMMLVLLLYPARKRIRFMREWGPIKFWFRFHMMLGVLGPVCVLFHANFQTGSMNSNVALFCMILVSSSGLMGRYFYNKIHYGLYGKKAALEELKAQSISDKEYLVHELTFSQEFKERLDLLESIAFYKDRGIIVGVFQMTYFRIRWWFSNRWFRKEVEVHLEVESEGKVGSIVAHHHQERLIKTHVEKARAYLKAYMFEVLKASELQFYDRLFSLWHVLHFPLFLMMVVSAIIHTVAVHLY